MLIHTVVWITESLDKATIDLQQQTFLKKVTKLVLTTEEKLNGISYALVRSHVSL